MEEQQTEMTEQQTIIREGQSSHVNGADTIVSIRNLHIHFHTDIGVARALNGVNLDVPRGKVLGVVGESGCGKSVMALSVMRLVPHPGRIAKGEIWLSRQRNAASGNGTEIHEDINLAALERNGPEIRRIRGAELAMIFQEPMTSLNPSYTVGNQIMEAVVLHQKTTMHEAHKHAVDMLDRVGMPNAKAVVSRYPHELSGGMRQRAMIAMALSCTPSMLIADEPTTALDVTTEAQILDVMRDLQDALGMTIMFITHNLGVVAQMCDEVAVMYLGRVVERATIEDIFYNPAHPYTQALLHSIPRAGSRMRERLKPIRGMVPDPYAETVGCAFYPRCDQAIPDKCGVKWPVNHTIGPTHTVRCYLYTDEGEVQNGG